MLQKPRLEEASASEQVDVFEIDRLPVAENRNDDGESDGRLSGGDGHHEHYEYLPGGSVKARERDEAEVDSREHQLDAHKDDDRVAVNQNADYADDEQRRSKG
jgi:hypothetical protein